MTSKGIDNDPVSSLLSKSLNLRFFSLVRSFHWGEICPRFGTFLNNSKLVNASETDISNSHKFP